MTKTYTVYCRSKLGATNTNGQPLRPLGIPGWSPLSADFRSKTKAEKLMAEWLAETDGMVQRLDLEVRVVETGTLESGFTTLGYSYIMCSNWREYYNDDGSLKPGANPTLRDAR